MTTTQLSLYNGALRLLSERRLASISEAREPRRLLDDAWGDGSTSGAVKHCLQLAQWTFATRTVMIDSSPSVEPSFGYSYAFDQPTDMVKLSAICQDEYFKVPLTNYEDERRYWYAGIDPIYVRYVSNHTDYGADLSLWPESFVKVVEAYLALEICGNLTQDKSKRKDVADAFKEALAGAKSIDGANTPTRFMPTGRWEAARRGKSWNSRSLWNGQSS